MEGSAPCSCCLNTILLRQFLLDFLSDFLLRLVVVPFGLVLRDALEARRIYVSVSPGTHHFDAVTRARPPAVRISPSYYNTEQEVDAVLAAVRGQRPRRTISRGRRSERIWLRSNRCRRSGRVRP